MQRILYIYVPKYCTGYTISSSDDDRKIYPRQAYNARGEPVFDMFPAKKLLREDIKDELYITTYKTTRKLQESRPLEYGLFDRKTFAGRVRQEKKLANTYICWSSSVQ
jgi:hypothetical protein